MSTFKEYLIEASYKVVSHDKTKKGSRFSHTVIIKSNKKVDFDEVAVKVGYHPIAYGITNSKAVDLKDGTWKYTFETATSAD